MRHTIFHSRELYAQRGQDPFVQEHVLMLVTSGFVDFYTGNDYVTYTSGSLGLLKRNQLVRVLKRPDGEIPFTSINIILDQQTLKKHRAEYAINADTRYTGDTLVVIKNDTFMMGFFNSLLPYFVEPEKLTPELEHIKTAEAINLLLLQNPSLKNFLFDFNDPYKIDLEAYMNRNFAYNIPLAQFAKLTGRSLSTYKRDFKKIFSKTPEKWLQTKRLEKAHFLLKQYHKRPSEIYLDVGFESFAHFSKAFKRQYGMNASALCSYPQEGTEH